MDTEARSPGDPRSGIIGIRRIFVASGFIDFFGWNYATVPHESFRCSNQKIVKRYFGENIRIAPGNHSVDLQALVPPCQCSWLKIPKSLSTESRNGTNYSG